MQFNVDRVGSSQFWKENLVYRPGVYLEMQLISPVGLIITDFN